MRKILRNKITGFVFGKYYHEKQIDEILIKDEEYISGIEIIFYSEIILILTIFSVIASIILAFTLTPLFLILLIPALILIYFSLDIELIYLTSERLIIERRTIVEKMLKTSNIKSISLDQIAVISYSRAPFQFASLFLSLLGIVTISYSIMYDNFELAAVFSLTPISLYLAYYGLRLTKRSIEISVIGVAKPFGVGRVKGAPVWFLNDLQNMIFERVHHTFHSEESYDIHEFPLEYSGRVRELVKQLTRAVQKKIIQLLDEKTLSKNEIIDLMPNYSKTEIDEGMRQLRVKKYIYYHRSIRKWCLDKMTLISDLENNVAVEN
ncbi:MAG: hypothetical protein HeimC2_03090 [Candidatus Heimdallarchaeota archaeon LC_2]|nr:MAG: hypothetical protein HeimC2_03090 [Candidatus Heimdallarchaeota archaeon LC_2]